MTIINWLLKKSIHRHTHIVKVNNISWGVKDSDGDYPITAIRFKCTICGATIDDITDSGLTQLENGNKRENVFRWVCGE